MIKSRKLFFIGYLLFSVLSLGMEDIDVDTEMDEFFKYLLLPAPPENDNGEPEKQNEKNNSEVLQPHPQKIDDANAVSFASNNPPRVSIGLNMVTAKIIAEESRKEEEQALSNKKAAGYFELNDISKILESKKEEETGSDGEVTVYSDDEAVEEPILNEELPKILPIPSEEEFRLIPDKCNDDNCQIGLANRESNRKDDIYPFDFNMVEVDGKYLNASAIVGKMIMQISSMYIATQSPIVGKPYYLNVRKKTEPTDSTFWLMIWQENAPVIVMLTDFSEKGEFKAEKYWPESNKTIEYESVKVTTVLEKNIGCVSATLLKLTKQPETRFVLHLHYTKWKDGQGVSIDDMIQLMEIEDLWLNKMKEINPQFSKEVIHCSVGVGRTGAYILMRMYKKLIEQYEEQGKLEKPGEVIQLASAVEKLRRLRAWMVRSPEQYLSIAYVINKLYHNSLRLNPKYEKYFNK